MVSSSPSWPGLKTRVSRHSRFANERLGLDPDQHDLRRQAADLAMSLGYFKVARYHLKALLGRGEPGLAANGAG